MHYAHRFHHPGVRTPIEPLRNARRLPIEIPAPIRYRQKEHKSPNNQIGLHMKSLQFKIAILIACLTAHPALIANAQDWPQWRGANHDAKTSGFTPPGSGPSN